MLIISLAELTGLKLIEVQYKVLRYAYLNPPIKKEIFRPIGHSSPCSDDHRMLTNLMIFFYYTQRQI